MATLYRYYDLAGLLLYVGQTRTGIQRSYAHAAGADWWHLVHFAEFHEVPSHSINLAERLVIWVERPLFNRAGRVSTTKRQQMLARPVETDFGYIVGERKAGWILGLAPDEVVSAVRWGFLKCDYPRKIDLTVDQLREFIGESDPGPADPYRLVGYGVDHFDRRLTSSVLRVMRT